MLFVRDIPFFCPILILPRDTAVIFVVIHCIGEHEVYTVEAVLLDCLLCQPLTKVPTVIVFCNQAVDGIGTSAVFCNSRQSAFSLFRTASSKEYGYSGLCSDPIFTSLLLRPQDGEVDKGCFLLFGGEAV